VDSVKEVIHLPHNNIEPARQPLPVSMPNSLLAWEKWTNDSLFFLTRQKILSQQERSALAEVENAGD